MLFHGLGTDDISALLHQGELLECSGDALLVHAGQTALTVFVLLEGSAEVRKNGRAIYSLAEGDVFGEVAFLTGQRRTADVRATSERVRLLCLSDGTLRRFVESRTQAGTTLLLNFARGLCVKLEGNLLPGLESD